MAYEGVDMRRPLPGSAECPCGSGLNYGRCCKKKKIVWEMDGRGNLTNSVKLDRESIEALENQLDSFLDTFGRNVGKSDLVFFDRKYIDHKKGMWLALRDASRKAELPQHWAFASEKSGIMLAERNVKKVADIDIEEWRAAAEEFHLLRENGVDPFLTLDFPGPEHAAVVLEAHEALKMAIIHLGSFIDKVQRRSMKKLQHMFALYFVARAFNAAKTIYGVTKEFEARELVGIARSIYECYLRVRYLRYKPEVANDFAAQASLGGSSLRESASRPSLIRRRVRSSKLASHLPPWPPRLKTPMTLWFTTNCMG